MKKEKFNLNKGDLKSQKSFLCALKKHGLHASFGFLFLAMVGNSKISPLVLDTYADEINIEAEDNNVNIIPVEETTVEYDNVEETISKEDNFQPNNVNIIKTNVEPEENTETSDMTESVDESEVSDEFEEAKEKAEESTSEQTMELSNLSFKEAVENSLNEVITTEAKINYILPYYQMNVVDFNSFVNAVLVESSLSGSSLTREEIISVLYDLSFIPNEVKINTILSNQGMTMGQLDAVASVVMSEAYMSGYNYVDAYAVATTMLNRICSFQWGRCGINAYQQAYYPGQFEVVRLRFNLKFIGRWELIGFQATVDCLYMGASLPMHGYTSFRSWGRPAAGRVHYVTGGNRYFNPLNAYERMGRYGLTDESQLLEFGDVYIKEKPKTLELTLE